MTKKTVKEIIIITLGVAVMACGLKVFLVPAKIAAGGISGIAVILYYLLKIPIGVTIITLNIPLFILGIKNMGKMFGLKTLYATLLLSVFTEIISVNGLAEDLFLSSAYGGLLVGLGLGLILKNGGTTGGTDMAAKILNNRNKNIGINLYIFIVDFFVIFASGIVFSPVSALYAIASLYLNTKVIEFLLEGLKKAKAFLIITDKAEDVSEVILHRLKRGATMFYGRGMYTGEKRNMILCIVERMSEVEVLKKEIKKLDERAFIISADVKEVLGEGFIKT